ncbi:SpdD protein [Streptomyces sp. NBC_00249]|uniref:SpdD protein n=1 Tax=Streptomyces sp. NBC_00249 TaxID=2975690 RepID=UPI0022510064|nr:SpdD protein [Streptomyces sp. NBC_00249]MCX5198019.1 SpdD protein [Streptomyces sp. NBC_00249]
MFKPQYPRPDTYTPATRPTPAPVEPSTPAPAPVPAKPPTAFGALVQQSPGSALLLFAGGIAGVLALASVAVSLLLAVAVTAVALSISGVVLLFLVRALRQEFKGH